MFAKKFASRLIVFILLYFCLVNNLCANNQRNLTKTPIIGFIGANPEDFILLKKWGASTIVYSNPRTHGKELDDIIKAANRYVLNVILRAPDKRHFQTRDRRIDFKKLKQMLQTFFEGSHVLNNPNFIGLYLIDEPIHPTRSKWNITAEELNKLYKTVKDFNPCIRIFINFGSPQHLETYLDSAKEGWKLADFAMFTITEKKLKQKPDYISYADKVAEKAKQLDPEMKIIPAVAVVEFIIERKNGTYIIPMPSADWVKDVNQEILMCDNFDGVLFYSYSSKSRWMGKTIADVVEDDKEYVNAFETIFNAISE